SSHSVLWSEKTGQVRFGSNFWRGVYLGDFRKARDLDEDLGEWMDILDGQTTEKHLLDKIAREQYQIGEDGSIVIDKPRIDIPSIHHGNSDGQGEGVGSGDGEEGDVVGKPDPGEGEGKAGDQAGDNKLAPWQHRYSPSEI